MELLAAVRMVQRASACPIVMSWLHHARRCRVFLGPCKHHTVLTAPWHPATRNLEAWRMQQGHFFCLPVAELLSTHMAAHDGSHGSLKQASLQATDSR